MRTTVGDVLILKTSRTFTIHAIGSVERDGQVDFRRPQKVHHLVSFTEALRPAETMMEVDGRAHLMDIDTGGSRDISGEIWSTGIAPPERGVSDSAAL